MDELRDIAGLAPISWWPLATGWWIVAFISLCILIGLVVYLVKRYQYLSSWRGKSYKNLSILEQELHNDNLKTCVQSLSDEIRNIAMHKQTREECASLSAEKWLQWLQNHDPKGFVWTKEGSILVEAQYAPLNDYKTEQVATLITAIKNWVR